MKRKFLTVLAAVILGGALVCGLSACDDSGKLTYAPIEANGETVGYSVEGTTDKYGIKSVTIPENYNGLPVTEIGEGAFSSCLKLSSLTIPATVTKIGESAFNDCKSLTKVNYNGDIAGWCGIEFGSMSSNPTFYTEKIYINNQLVTDVDVPDTVEKISGYAFYNCTEIKSVTLPETLTVIGQGAFSKCSAIESLNIPKNVKTIENEAFSECLALKEINFNAENCDDLLLNNYVFSRAGQSGDGISVKIGAGVTKVPDYLFRPKDGSVTVNGFTGSSSSYVPKITSLTFENGSKCTAIGSYTFHYCYDLISVSLPSSLENIGEFAFSSCNKLAEITIPASVTQIGGRAFLNCSSAMRTVFEDTSGWVRISESDKKSYAVDSEALSDPLNATKLLNQTYVDGPIYGYIWNKI